jgi:hypothetical protein
MPDDADYARVGANSFGPNLCTPPIRDDRAFRGIALTGPTAVEFGADTRDPLFDRFCHFVVCGAYQLDANYMGLRERFRPRLLVVAVDALRHRSYAGRLETGPNPMRMPSPLDGMALDDADFAGRVVTEYFNPNVAELMGLPEEETDYFVWATLGHYTSNVVRVALRRRGSVSP